MSRKTYARGDRFVGASRSDKQSFGVGKSFFLEVIRRRYWTGISSRASRSTPREAREGQGASAENTSRSALP